PGRWQKSAGVFPVLGSAQLASAALVYCLGHSGTRTRQPDTNHLLLGVALQVRDGQCQIQSGTGRRQLPGLQPAQTKPGPAELLAQCVDSAAQHRPHACLFCVADSASGCQPLHAN
ncbi:MAG: hypothetical protein ACTMK5_17860, partial [Pseudomonas helleri]